jgi:twitching motility protein PilT
MDTRIEDMMKMAVANKASDIHLMEGTVPRLRINGEFVDISNFKSNGEADEREMILSLLDKDKREIFEKQKELDFSSELESARFRINVFMSQGRVAAALRVVTNTIPDLPTLGLPDTLLG